VVKRPRNVARKAIEFALAKKAEDIMLFDLRGITTMADFFVICSGGSDVQVKAIAESILDGCKDNDIQVYHVEGMTGLNWVLIDLVDVVVHVFRPETRKYYQLERLWGDAKIERFGDDEEEAVQ
jgi:ribosome-associated protein